MRLPPGLSEKSRNGCSSFPKVQPCGTWHQLLSSNYLVILQAMHHTDRSRDAQPDTVNRDGLTKNEWCSGKNRFSQVRGVQRFVFLIARSNANSASRSCFDEDSSPPSCAKLFGKISCRIF